MALVLEEVERRGSYELERRKKMEERREGKFRQQQRGRWLICVFCFVANLTHSLLYLPPFFTIL
jgi:hypothetical protein